MQDRNDKHVCLHHPGRFEFGSEQGLWPEGWTCCRGQWESNGCTLGVHRGQPKNEQIKLCINHGELNPKSVYADSFCGRSFVVDGAGKRQDDDKCFYHSGYFIVRSKKTGDGIWSCCRSDEKDGVGCIASTHKSVEYPEEEAKKYFYDKQVNSDTNDNDFELYGRFCGYYRKRMPYVAKNPSRPI